ncbi:uncharacterized protein B0H18DRAFT_367264 [Fomitopsis serialis]|uniref:uncharacterized protein n=1 Tax=Fomitopsis serialis TaxID=139415 RepID=UPI0020075C7D|nr:uncharacterized protein B0H18DRAFT_367264 [Neoantrodia serialis]KAH9925780.1 hypothetical protein B0H18DRAFT_367264 [Neoantrodia serialis]
MHRWSEVSLCLTFSSSDLHPLPVDLGHKLRPARLDIPRYGNATSQVPRPTCSACAHFSTQGVAISTASRIPRCYCVLALKYNLSPRLARFDGRARAAVYQSTISMPPMTDFNYPVDRYPLFRGRHPQYEGALTAGNTMPVQRRQSRPHHSLPKPKACHSDSSTSPLRSTLQHDALRFISGVQSAKRGQLAAHMPSSLHCKY